MRSRIITERCAECGSEDLYQGYDVMLPLEKLHNNTLELDDYLDGSFNEYVYCMNCGDEVDTAVAEDWE